MPLPFRKQLLKEFDTFLSDRGFERHSDQFYGDRYDRPSIGGRQSLSIASHLRKPTLLLDPAFAGIRLDAVEEEVFRFEQKTELVSDHDALQRNTIGLRLEANELFNVASNRYAITSERDCPIIGERYISEMIERAERFWKEFSSADVILATLRQVSDKARNYAGTDLFASERATVLMKQHHGTDSALEFARQINKQLAEAASQEFRGWLQRAETVWRAI